jgi:hypothetical protein
MGLSYLRYGLTAIADSLYGHSRPSMSCLGSEFEYCHYKDPKLILRDLGMADTTTLGQIVALVSFALVYRFVAYLALRYRLTSEFSNQVLNYIAKILRHKWNLSFANLQIVYFRVVRLLALTNSDATKWLEVLQCIFEIWGSQTSVYKSAIFWFAFVCSLIEVYWLFVRICCFYLQGRWESRPSMQQADCLLSLHFNPAYGSTMFIWNADKLIPDYTASQARR